MVEREVPGFLPSVHGLGFPNAFPPGPTVRLGPLDPRPLGIGDAAAGLCGGMALTAGDLWAAGIPAPPGSEPPANGSRRFRALVRRQVESLDWLRVPLRYALLGMWRPDPPTGLASLLGREPVRVPTATRELARILDEVDAGRPCLVELVRAAGTSPAALVRNHQVLVWACVLDGPARGAAGLAAVGGTARLRAYDPNHPGRDDVELRVEVAPPDGRALRDRITLAQSTGEPLLGFFRGPCLAPAGVGAWR
jgi:hypothetical protein